MKNATTCPYCCAACGLPSRRQIRRLLELDGLQPPPRLAGGLQTMVMATPTTTPPSARPAWHTLLAALLVMVVVIPLASLFPPTRAERNAAPALIRGGTLHRVTKQAALH